MTAQEPSRTDLLDTAEQALRGAVTAQREDRDPDHADFYTWGYLLTVIAEQVEQVGRVLAEQIGDYAVTHQLYDDAGTNPGQRVDQATDALDDLVGWARLLRTSAARYHAEVGHVGVVHDEGGER